MSLVLWFAGLIGLVIAAGVASGRGRATPNDVFGRGVIAAAALAYAAIVVAAVWLWSGEPAVSGRAARLADGASVSLALRAVRVPLDRSIAIGRDAAADVRVAGVGAAKLVQIDVAAAAQGPRRALVRAGAPALEVAIAPVGLGADPAAVAARLAASCKPDPAGYTLPQGAAVVAVECAPGKPRRALVVRRGAAREQLEVTPLAWRGRFVAERLVVRAGDALRVGGGDAPIPGVNTWDVAAPRGAAGMLAVPADPTDCAAWSLEAGAARAVDGGCEIDAGAFAVTAVPLVPQAELVTGRAALAALAIGAPPLVLLIALAALRRRGRRAHVLARTLRLCVLGAGLTALACWRLLWAYRIDVLRELAPAGSRVADNRFAAVAIGAALAGCAVLALGDLHQQPEPAARALARRAALALAAWAAWLAIGWLAADLGAPALDAKTAGVLALSLGAALIPLAGDAWRRAPRLPPDALLAGITVTALIARRATPSAVLVKLGLAYLVVLAGHAALRLALEQETSLLRRARCLAALAAAALAVASLDAGVTLAIIGAGLALAMLVAGHDATYDASKALRLGVLEREHARLLLVHGGAAIALAIGVAAAVLGASHREMLEHGADAVLHAPLVFAVLFALAAVVARSHRRGWMPWLAAALAALAVWGARGDLLERVTAGSYTGAHRVSALVEPGYALLRDERAFAANVAAWQEAAFAPSAEVDRWRGQGYFGARVRDAGVTRSIDNDYLPVLVAREGGVLGLMQGIALLLAIIVGGGVLASVRLRHASREHRARWLVTAVAGSLAVYQPLAALGVLPLTGISWPGLGIDSPADLWLFVIGCVWCYLGAESAVSDDERVRQTPRLARARRVALAALAACGLAAIVVVARAGWSALGRVTGDDGRIDAALQYVETIKCDFGERAGGKLDELVPALVAGAPSDDGTARFERELRSAWLEDRPKLLAAMQPPAPPRASAMEAVPLPIVPAPSAAPAIVPLGLAPAGATGAAGAAGAIVPMPVAASASTPASAKARAAATANRSTPSPVEGARGARDANAASSAKAAQAAKPAKPAKPASAAAAAGGARPGRPGGKQAAPGGKQAPSAADKPEPDDDPIVATGADPAANPDAATPAPLPTPACRGRVGRWQLARDGEACVATFRVGWPEVKLAVRPHERGLRATCTVVRDDDALAVLRAPARAPRAPRIRVVSAAMGAAAADLGELVAGGRVVRLRASAPAVELASAPAGLHAAAKATIAPGVSLELRDGPRRVVLRGAAELFVAGEQGAWRRMVHADEVALDQLTLIVAGAPERRALALFRPARLRGGAAVVDPLLADETNRIGDRVRRAYPYGAALPELGWVNPFDLDRSLGLDGWIHASYVMPAAPAPACGALEPPAIPRDQVCARSPLDGVVECRVALQPELALSLRRLVARILEEPKPHTGRDVYPVRVSYVALRGDTGELIAQANVAAGRRALAYAPADADAEAALVRLREERGESDAERVEWNLPIAVGSTLKPIVARAAELAFPRDVGRLNLSSTGTGGGCRSRRGAVGPILGHCPPTSVAGQPASADLHDFLARSPNWYQMALGLVGLGLPDGRLAAGDAPVSLADIAGSDLGAWPTGAPLLVSDASGAILGRRGLSVAGMRRTPLWSRVERLLGRPLCTLGDRASCERAAARADVCAARGLPIASPGADLRYLVALGPDRIDPYGDDRPAQTSVPVREYLQLLRGSGVHSIGSLAQLTDAFGRVIYDPEGQRLAASWFPAPVAGVLPDWKCTEGAGREPKVRGDEGGLCGVLRAGGTAHNGAGALLADPALAIYGAKTGTIDSLAEIARRPRACAAWNARHDARTRLDCGKTPPDDSLFVIAFGVVTPQGTIPITLGLALQRSGSGAAARVAPHFVREIAKYLRGA
jgi:hypothetical protein